MNPQIAKWNARYADREPGALPEPSPPLPGAVAGVPPGRALDLACGAGRHAVWLASRGWRVAAVDGSDAAVALLLANAERADCRERIAPHVADLEADPPEFTIEPAAYDLIVDCYFLHRPLFAAVRGGVRPGGLFVAALHLPAPDGQRGHRYVLRPGELERMVRGWRWDVLHAAERTARVAAGDEPGVAEIVARRPDVRPPSHS
ncbi:MAG: methyltransferase domain-containing protein [Acidobacteria bacterium]|nr:methyltransferase domain-containing protein [Acidobacteriota bacterium]